MNTTASPTPTSAQTAPASRCLNCGAELHGDHCHACGQPVKGMIRPLSSMLHDVADTIFNIDSRIFHTLVPLYFRPGFLTREYFAGRRVRYVTPFRLYFFLSVLAFFLIQISLSSLKLHSMNLVGGDDRSISSAMTPQEVTARRDAALARLQSGKAVASAIINATPAAGEAVPAMNADMEKAAAGIRREADARLGYLQKVADAKVKGEAPPPDPDTNFIELNDKPWDAQTNPIRIGWLPDFVNAKLNAAAEHARENLPRIRKNPGPFFLGAIGLLPQVLFVLMPLFALLLKIFYIFRRRLYMEHLIVALHSHAFVFLSMLLLTLATLARGWAKTSAPWLVPPLGFAIFLMWWWLPIYLFLMQKKVYRQGWFFSTVKYCAIGICYTIMISLGIAAAFVISLATT
ncbi:MAG: DUF3667 domain-containing protein [Rudaea sp.]